MTRQRLLRRPLCSLSQPSRYGWHAKSSPGREMSQPPSFPWEVHLTASSLSLLLQFLLILLSCIQQKCSEACNPASLLATPVNVLLVSEARWARGWGPGPFSLKVANVIINFPCQSPRLQDWLPATLQEEIGVRTTTFSPCMGWGLGHHPQGTGSFLLLVSMWQSRDTSDPGYPL